MTQRRISISRKQKQRLLICNNENVEEGCKAGTAAFWPSFLQDEEI